MVESGSPELPLFFGMVERYAKLWHGGQIPTGAARAEFLCKLLDEYAPDSDRLLTNILSEVQWKTHRQETANQLAFAIERYDLLWRTGFLFAGSLADEREAHWKN